MLDSLVSLLESVAMRALHSNDPIEPLGNDHALSAPFGTYRTADSEIAITIANDPLFVRFAEAVGRPEWPSDPRFATDAKRALHRAELRVEVEDGFRTIGSALKLGDPPRAHRPAPLLGEHQQLIERWLAEPVRT